MLSGNFEHPGYAFIERYGLPTSRKSLGQCVSQYIEFLFRASGITDQPPIDIDVIINKFQITCKPTAIENPLLAIDGFASNEFGLILYSNSDSQTRQRFTLAHELIEYLVGALHRNQLSNSVQRYLEGDRKEKLCNWGASRLLMPLGSIRKHVKEMGISLGSVQSLANLYKTSTLATLYHLVNSYPRHCALIVWRLALRKSEEDLVARKNQTSLFEQGYRHQPEKKLRVWWSVFAGESIRRRPPFNKSISENSVIYRAWETAELCVGEENIELGSLTGKYPIEAMPIYIDGDKCVLSLIHWPDEISEQRLFPL